MNLAELEKRYATELINIPSIKSLHTKEQYISSIRKFHRENKFIYRMTTVDIKLYMSGIRDKYSDSYYNTIGSALKILYAKVFTQPQKMKWFTPIKTYKKFHNIISQNEFIKMGKKCSNSKQKIILVLLYSTGIRRQELIDIKLCDIDFANKRIFIHSAKGGKNRFVKLHSMAERYLLKYIKEWNPKTYLLNGQYSLQYSGSSIASIIKNISGGKYHPHSFRHTFLTNLIEHENVFATQDYAGHTSLKSTLHYYHVSSERLRDMYNPLDDVATKSIQEILSRPDVLIPHISSR